MRAEAHPAEQFDDGAQQYEAAQLGMWVFLATEVLFLGTVFVVYGLYRLRDPAAFAEASRHTDLWLGALESAVLLTSATLTAWAGEALERDRGRLAAALLAVAALLGLGFLAMHGAEYAQDAAHGLEPGPGFRLGGPATGAMQRFYLLYDVATGFHALHVLVGVAVLATMAWMARAGRLNPGRTAPLMAANLYWQLVDIVWIFLFPMFYLVDRS